MTPLAQALDQLGPVGRRKLRLALARAGVMPHLIDRFARGEGDPAPWVRRAVAAALQRSERELWPQED